MVKIQFLGLSPECVEGFSQNDKQTFQGSLHLKPNQVYDISKVEFEHVKKVRPDLKFYVFQLGKTVIKSKLKKDVQEKKVDAKVVEKKVISDKKVDEKK